jgi:hypothetical protein
VDFRRLAETRLAVLEEMRTENDELFASKMELLDENERLRGVIRSLAKEVRKLTGEDVSEDEKDEDRQQQTETAIPNEVEQQEEEPLEEDKEQEQENNDDAVDNDQSEAKAKGEDEEEMEEAKRDTTI